MYTPMKKWGVRDGGKRVGIVGLGGLGQMGVLLAKAMGNEVTVISRSFCESFLNISVELSKKNYHGFSNSQKGPSNGTWS